MTVAIAKKVIVGTPYQPPNRRRTVRNRDSNMLAETTTKVSMFKGQVLRVTIQKIQRVGVAKLFVPHLGYPLFNTSPALVTRREGRFPEAEQPSTGIGNGTTGRRKGKAVLLPLSSSGPTATQPASGTRWLFSWKHTSGQQASRSISTAGRGMFRSIFTTP